MSDASSGRAGHPKRIVPVWSERTTKAIDLLKNGYSLKTVSTEAGIPHELFLKCLQKGRRGNRDYAQFALRVDQAIAECEKRLVDRVVEASADNAAHAEWLLERRFPKEWAKRSYTNVEVQNQVEKLLTSVKEHMSLGAYGELVRALAHLSGMDSATAIDVTSAEPEQHGNALPASTDSETGDIPKPEG